eukprot:6179403-Pleurochrysis_carterae.AAC.6
MRVDAEHAPQLARVKHQTLHARMLHAHTVKASTAAVIGPTGARGPRWVVKAFIIARGPQPVRLGDRDACHGALAVTLDQTEPDGGRLTNLT